MNIKRQSRVITRFISYGLVAAIIVLVPSYASATKIVFMNFGGDGAFPSITFDHPTAGLANFTGSAFGYTTGVQETSLESLILGFVQADYSPYNVSFSTTQPAGVLGTDWFRYGIDDTAYTFKDGPVPNNNNARLFGKANGIGIPADTARTWAGSFALTNSNQPYLPTVPGPSLSSPALTSASGMNQIAQALGNNAAHEIAHLFGVVHEGLDNGQPSQTWNLMETNIESIMASTNKTFSSQANTQLLSYLGPSNNNNNTAIPEPTSLLLLGTGLGGIALAAYRRKKV